MLQISDPPRYASVSKRLDGRVAVVTGACSGIGRAVALAYAREGACVVLASHRENEIGDIADAIRSCGGSVVTVRTDMSEEGSAKALIDTAISAFGQIDIAFNNAGITVQDRIERLGVSDFDRVMTTNVRGIWLLIKHEVEAMRATGRGGAIVNTCSVAATGISVGCSVHAVSKGALDAMIRALALEVGPDGIRINNLSPGVEDIASVAVWLSTDEARFVSGQSILADGGFYFGATAGLARVVENHAVQA